MSFRTIYAIMASLVLLAGSGCRTTAIHSARRDFYDGRLEKADQRLSKLPPENDKDKVLYLMERGAIRQARNDLDGSTSDWLRAVSVLKYNEPYSFSRGAASLVINDRSLTFRGFPYERTLLRTMLANNFLAQGDWQGAGVEARNIIDTQRNLDGFPDDAFSRYVAGFSLEMTGDREGAALQYRRADALLDHVQIDDRSGRPRPAGGGAVSGTPPAPASGEIEMVVFVFGGRSPSGDHGFPANTSGISGGGYAAFSHHGRFLGRSYRFSDTATLLGDSTKRLLALQTARDVTRIVVKETIVQTLFRENESLGVLAGVLLYSTEAPDNRRWETLPRTLHVARFNAPADLDEITIVYRDRFGAPRQQRTVAAPFSKRAGTYFMFCRDTPPFPP